MCIQSIKSHVKDPINKIYIISGYEVKSDDPNIVYVPESRYIFSKQDVFDTLSTPNKQELVHWYYQQLLKIYALKEIPVLDDVLVVDADCIFLKDFTFIKDGTHRFGHHDKVEQPYADHALRLHPSLTSDTKSGVVDYQIWNKHAWEEIISLVEKHHDDVFWRVFLKCAREAQSASEYEIYFQYYIRTRPYELLDTKRTISNEVSRLDEFRNEYDTVSFHRWIGARK
jgi:hypothetical protein